MGFGLELGSLQELHDLPWGFAFCSFSAACKGKSRRKWILVSWGCLGLFGDWTGSLRPVLRWVLEKIPHVAFSDCWLSQSISMLWIGDSKSGSLSPLPVCASLLKYTRFTGVWVQKCWKLWGVPRSCCLLLARGSALSRAFPAFCCLTGNNRGGSAWNFLSAGT